MTDPQEPPGALSLSEVEAIEARLRAATPAPWRDGHDGPNDPSFVDDSDGEPVAEVYGGCLCRKNAEFIAHAPEDVGRLLAEVKRLRGEVERLRDVLLDGCDS